MSLTHLVYYVGICCIKIIIFNVTLNNKPAFLVLSFSDKNQRLVDAFLYSRHILI